MKIFPKESTHGKGELNGFSATNPLHVVGMFYQTGYYVHDYLQKRLSYIVNPRFDEIVAVAAETCIVQEASIPNHWSLRSTNPATLAAEIQVYEPFDYGFRGDTAFFGDWHMFGSVQNFACALSGTEGVLHKPVSLYERAYTKVATEKVAKNTLLYGLEEIAWPQQLFQVQDDAEHFTEELLYLDEITCDLTTNEWQWLNGYLVESNLYKEGTFEQFLQQLHRYPAGAVIRCI